MKKFVVMDCCEREMQVIGIFDTEQEARNTMKRIFKEYFNDHNGLPEDENDTWGKEDSSYWANLDNMNYDIRYEEVEFESEEIIMKETRKAIRTKEEILDYLILPNKNYDEDIVLALIKDAQTVEDKYYIQLKEHEYEYALLCDFINSPFILEDEDEEIELKKVDRVGGIVVYRKEEIDMKEVEKLN